MLFPSCILKIPRIALFESDLQTKDEGSPIDRSTCPHLSICSTSCQVPRRRLLIETKRVLILYSSWAFISYFNINFSISWWDQSSWSLRFRDPQIFLSFCWIIIQTIKPLNLYPSLSALIKSFPMTPFVPRFNLNRLTVAVKPVTSTLRLMFFWRNIRSFIVEGAAVET